MSSPVADGDSDNRILLVRLFESKEHVTIPVGDCDEARKRLREPDIDFAILDVASPRMGGGG